MHVGVPVAPISPAYSLMSKDFAKLKAIFELLRPGLVWTSDPEKFAPALAAVGASRTPIAELLARAPGTEVDAAFERIGPDTVAKILFTSGSTGMPKGVINTQRMLTVNQEQYALVWPFLEDRPQVLVDWLPWNHTFGGNNNFCMMLRNGGTIYIDAGKPAPGLVETSVRNLKEISPTIYFNVPRGFDLLLPFLEKDASLRASFFRKLELDGLRGRGAAAEPLGARAAAGDGRARRAAAARLGLGLDRNRAAGDLRPLRGRARRHHRPAGARLRAEARARRRQARSARERSERHAGLLRARRSDPRRVRRGRLLPHRRRAEVRRSGKTRSRASPSTGASPRTSSSPPAPGCTSARRA